MPKGIRNLQISVGEEHLTHFGGIFLIHWFCKKLELNRTLQRYVRFHQRNNRYTISDLILSLVYAIIAGLGRINATRILKYNSSFQDIVGLKSFPGSTTLRRFLLRLSPKALHQIIGVHDSYRLKLIQYPYKPTGVILDLDSTVLTVYGKQEKSAIGYNPHKRGRPSYQPLLCFEAHTQDCLHGKLRSGIKPTGVEEQGFIHECLGKLPQGIYRIKVRGDSGFYNHKVIEFLDEKKIGYAIVAKITGPIRPNLSSLNYHEFRYGWEADEFSYQPHGWKEPHRFIVIRRPIPEEPNAQLTLFKLKKHVYQVIVTNLSLSPESVYRFYICRCAVELNIKELKENFSLIKIPSRAFLANEVYFHLILLAYNLMNWFKRICLPKEFQNFTLQTIRAEFPMLPAKLVKSGSKNLLRLPKGYVYDWVLKYTTRKIQRLRLP